MKNRYRVSILPAVAPLCMLPRWQAATPAVLNQPTYRSSAHLPHTGNFGALLIGGELVILIPGRTTSRVRPRRHSTATRSGWINWTAWTTRDSTRAADCRAAHLFQLRPGDTVASHRTSYTVKGLDGGDTHFISIMRATTLPHAILASALGKWLFGMVSSWSSSPAQPAGQPGGEPTPSIDCIAAGTCPIPIANIGTLLHRGG